MPLLTLEQVLARSMRLPRKHMKPTAVPIANTQALGTSISSETSLGRNDKSVAKLFSLIEKDEETMTAGRPSIHQSHNLIRNSQDLLTYLNTAKRMRAWEDALLAFAEATKMLLIKQTEGRNGVSLILREGADRGVEGGEGVTANVAHLAVLLHTCAEAKQWDLVQQIGEIFRKQSPQTLIDAVSLLANTKKEDVSEGFHGRELALHFLQTRIPPGEQPVEAYNVCVAACEATLDWEGALTIVRFMGPNVFQNIGSTVVSSEKAVDVTSVGSTPEEVPSSVHAELKEESALSTFHPPTPDVVTYATLISVLEQSGKDALASEILQRLPPLEKEEITATYAALIHVWAEQKYRHHRRRF
ncbi:hypothetical protein TraAM80_04531 [Trypanosoma rangeli]|uniref:Uncharacterized protein n=1 Tax=Trypanosoma rangeli TaxID=5698 RepID=A0A422NJ49_TRYRA|nr:uncharacterized protein TraAM80_04531 [Trypanosoma rangeli]RNF05491.1 hypothetical protein TraAM80_04531 [Trypanosoma rangeli]|eukprot:RNF05491.1 hypothetical protein TraAM80_04531 [Trypanosoma rangeli]